MDQVRNAGVVTDLQDDEVQEEMKEVVDKLLFKLRQVIEDRDRLIVQLRTAKRKHVIPAEEKEQPPLKRVDRGPRTRGMFQITPTSSTGSVCKSGFKTGKRLQLDQTGLEKRPDCSLGLWYLKIKDRKKTGLFGQVSTGLNRSFVPSNYPFKMSQISSKLM